MIAGSQLTFGRSPSSRRVGLVGSVSRRGRVRDGQIRGAGGRRLLDEFDDFLAKFLL